MGGSNQMMFIITALFAGQGGIHGQGSAAVPLLIVGLLLSWAVAPAWTEEQRLFLEREGCGQIQGYLIGRPRSIADYAELTAGPARASATR